MTYCEYIQQITGATLDLHKESHGKHYGFLIKDDNELFERLMFEISIGYLPGAHSIDCPVYHEIKKIKNRI